MVKSILVDSNGEFWVDLDTAEEGPFPSILAASEFVVQFMTSRAKLFEPNVYFLQAKGI